MERRADEVRLQSEIRPLFRSFASALRPVNACSGSCWKLSILFGFGFDADERILKKIAIIVGHSKKASFCEALATAYRDGARAAGHEARMYVLANMLFDPILYEAYAKVQPLEPDLKAAHDAIIAADHLVIVFPLWLGDMPAMLKGFLERILQPDLIEPARKGQFVKLLNGKSARVVVTMGMPAFVYRWYFNPHAAKILKRNILGFLGVRPVRSTFIGNIEGMGDDARKVWIENVEALGRAAE